MYKGNAVLCAKLSSDISSYQEQLLHAIKDDGGALSLLEKLKVEAENVKELIEQRKLHMSTDIQQKLFRMQIWKIDIEQESISYGDAANEIIEGDLSVTSLVDKACKFAKFFIAANRRNANFVPAMQVDQMQGDNLEPSTKEVLEALKVAEEAVGRSKERVESLLQDGNAKRAWREIELLTQGVPGLITSVHTWNDQTLGLKLQDCPFEGGGVKVTKSTMPEFEGLFIAEINGEDVRDKTHGVIKGKLQHLLRPVTVKFALTAQVPVLQVPEMHVMEELLKQCKQWKARTEEARRTCERIGAESTRLREAENQFQGFLCRIEESHSNTNQTCRQSYQEEFAFPLLRLLCHPEDRAEWQMHEDVFGTEIKFIESPQFLDLMGRQEPPEWGQLNEEAKKSVQHEAMALWAYNVLREDGQPGELMGSGGLFSTVPASQSQDAGQAPNPEQAAQRFARVVSWFLGGSINEPGVIWPSDFHSMLVGEDGQPCPPLRTIQCTGNQRVLIETGTTDERTQQKSKEYIEVIGPCAPTDEQDSQRFEEEAANERGVLRAAFKMGEKDALGLAREFRQFRQEIRDDTEFYLVAALRRDFFCHPTHCRKLATALVAMGCRPPRQGLDPTKYPPPNQIGAIRGLIVDSDDPFGNAKSPMWEERHQIKRLVENNQVVVLTAATGSGKTVLIPPFIARDQEHLDDMDIVCTQPKRLAAERPARFVEMLLGGYEVEDWPRNRGLRVQPRYVGWHVGGSSPPNESCNYRNRPFAKLIYITEGSLKETMVRSRSSSRYRYYIVDEAHSRNVDTDFVLGLLKEKLVEDIRVADEAGETLGKIRIIVMSATVNRKKFVDFFTIPRANNRILKPCTTHISGTSKNVRVFLKRTKLEVGLTRETNLEASLIQAAVDTVKYIHDHHSERERREGRLDFAPDRAKQRILVFMTGNRDIQEVADQINAHDPQQLHALTLAGGGKTPAAQQERCLELKPEDFGKRIVIVATNVADASLTFSDLLYVVDAAHEKNSSFEPQIGANVLATTLNNRHNTVQRRGRVGRKTDGYAFHLISPEQFGLVKAACDWTDQNGMTVKGGNMLLLCSDEFSKADLVDLLERVLGVCVRVDTIQRRIESLLDRKEKDLKDLYAMSASDTEVFLRDRDLGLLTDDEVTEISRLLRERRLTVPVKTYKREGQDEYVSYGSIVSVLDEQGSSTGWVEHKDDQGSDEEVLIRVPKDILLNFDAVEKDRMARHHPRSTAV